MKKLIIIGAHGNGAVVASTVADINRVSPEWELLGFLDDRAEGEIHGYPVLGSVTKATIQKFLDDPEVYFYWALVSVKLREAFTGRLFELEIPEERFATVVHPSAVVSEFAKLGYGVSIQPLVNVGPGVEVGNYVHVFAQSMLGHDAVLEDFSYVANNACVGANVRLKRGAYLGTNATTIENIELGAWSLVGMASCVLKSVPDNAVVVGNPGKEIIRK
jgi:acetyltransferase EpsM